DCLAPDSGGETADRLALQQLSTGQPCACREPVGHGIGYQLRPALAPQIVRDGGAVAVADQTADFFGALRDPTVHLAGPKYGVGRSPLSSAPMDVAGFGQID